MRQHTNNYISMFFFFLQLSSAKTPLLLAADWVRGRDDE